MTVIVTNNENEIVNPFPCPLDAFEIAHLFQVALEIILILNKLWYSLSSWRTECCFPFRCGSHSVFNDDISNLCQTFTGVAANVFRDVMNDEVCGIPILFSTSCVMSSENSQLQNTDLAQSCFIKL